jgi:hypothetical protein
MFTSDMNLVNKKCSEKWRVHYFGFRHICGRSRICTEAALKINSKGSVNAPCGSVFVSAPIKILLRLVVSVFYFLFCTLTNKCTVN